MIAPMMKTEKNSAILVQDLSESRIPGMIIGGAQQGLIPPRADLHIRYADLEPYRQSAFGKYIARSMSHAMEAVRLAGMVVAALGAWQQSFWVIVAGIAIVLFGWLRGKISNA